MLYFQIIHFKIADSCSRCGLRNIDTRHFSCSALRGKHRESSGVTKQVQNGFIFTELADEFAIVSLVQKKSRFGGVADVAGKHASIFKKKNFFFKLAVDFYAFNLFIIAAFMVHSF